MFLLDDEPVVGGVDGGMPTDDTATPADDSATTEEASPEEGADQV